MADLYPRPQPGGGQTITTSGTSAKATNPAPPGISEVSLRATQDTYIRFDVTGGAATTADYFLPANETHFLGCQPDAYVHAIQVTSAGTVYVHWLITR